MLRRQTVQHLVISLSLVLGVALLGCSNKLEGELEVDGETFELDACRSGEVYGFVGVELAAKDGRRLRVVSTPTGAPVAVVMKAGNSKGVQLPDCGTFTVERQSSEINNVQNVEGKGDLDCEANGHSVKGAFTFENCH